MITLKDLRIAKSLCQPVFPPHYNILEHFLQLYHEALSNRASLSSSEGNRSLGNSEGDPSGAQNTVTVLIAMPEVVITVLTLPVHFS